jgi:hypothetical protein
MSTISGNERSASALSGRPPRSSHAGVYVRMSQSRHISDR